LLLISVATGGQLPVDCGDRLLHRVSWQTSLRYDWNFSKVHYFWRQFSYKW